MGEQPPRMTLVTRGPQRSRRPRRPQPPAAPPAPIVPALLTLAEAARYVALPFETLRYKVYRSRELPSVRLGTGRRAPRRVKRADLDAWIARSTVPRFEAVPGGQREAGR